MNEFRQFLDSLPSKPLLAALLVAWTALFHVLGNSSFGYIDTPSLFTWLEALYESNPDDALGYIIPFLVVALLYLKRDELMPLVKKPWAPALGLFGVAIALHVFGYLVQQTRISLLGYLLGLYALTGVLWGPAWMRRTAFPFALFFFCLPITAYADGLTYHLRLLSTKLASDFCTGILGLSLIREGTIVFHALPSGARGFQFDVAPACSGIRSLTVVLLLTLVYGYLNFETFWRRGALLATAVPLAVLGNVVRLITVFSVGEAFGQEAGAQIEQKLGFLTFLVALGGVLLAGRWLREGGPPPEPPSPTISLDPKAETA